MIRLAWFPWIFAACSGEDDVDPSSPVAESDTDTDTDTDSDTDTDTDTVDTGLGDLGELTHEATADGTRTTVAGWHDELPVYVSLADELAVTPADPLADSGWDLSFARYLIAVNGGVSGPGAAQVTSVPGASLADLQQAPAGPWTTDAADADGDGVLEYALLNWYDYDPTTHRLSPADRVYVIQTPTSGPIALAFDSYYRDDGASGYTTFTWKPLAAPSTRLSHSADGDATLTLVDASADDAWTTLSLFTRADTAPADRATDASWDLAFQRTSIQVNGGASGPGAVEVAWLDGVALDDITAAPASGFITDVADGGEVTLAMGAWFDYDYRTHTVSPKLGTYVVRTDRGAWAVQIVGYTNAAGDTGWPSLRWKAVSP